MPVVARDRDLHVTDQWASQSNAGAAFDYGAITLDSPIGDEVGWFGYVNMSDQELRNARVNVVGYPFDKPNQSMWGHPDVMKDVRPQVLEYLVDTVQGQSGSPVYLLENGKFKVVGIHNNGAGDRNLGTRINSDVFRQLQEWHNP
jgi:V8-like Glu-specific endopeptidase